MYEKTKKLSQNLYSSYFRENTAQVKAFVNTAEECKMTCSHDPMCGYYKYFDKVSADTLFLSCHLTFSSVHLI